MSERDVGVPEALARALRHLAVRVDPGKLDRVWLFPPRTRGRTESGVVAAGCYGEGDRRILVTVAYRAEETGRGVSFHPLLQEEGEAPEGRLPRIMEGVVKRSEADWGEPRCVRTGGDPAAFQALLDELSPEIRGSTEENPS